MYSIRFEWDENKAETNIKKHGISFEEAASVFYDEEAIIIDDVEHSRDEERFIILGISKLNNLLVVVHREKDNGNLIRIISARLANKKEEGQYVGQL